MERVRAAVLLPVRIAIKDVYDDTCTELLITASLDSGGRGRPRVTYDVTAALNTLGARVLCVLLFMCLHRPCTRLTSFGKFSLLHAEASYTLAFTWAQ